MVEDDLRRGIWVQPESIYCIVEDQAFSPSSDLVPSPSPPPPSRQQTVSLSLSSCGGGWDTMMTFHVVKWEDIR
jgi:hypothetical protein